MNEAKKFCADCKTTKTPLWRSGPHGPRSLCNACGIRFRKRKMADDDQQQQSNSEMRGESDDQINNDQLLKMNYNYGDIDDMILAQRSSSSSSSSSSSQLKKQRSSSEDSINSSKRNLGEVEQAAVLLMSLSCGSVFA
ncbi:GATA transcription factor 17-like [Chenopodium quinoa]|uniref:GATA transcription factor 17-like n=1 Tax=Chenopodium quinoa TaxID=63459 RepID=UPI000B784919|nr:GATA transcription factor 17-like [Chenopodium quinoa]